MPLTPVYEGRKIGRETKEAVIHALMFPKPQGSVVLAQMLAEHWKIGDYFGEQLAIWHEYEREHIRITSPADPSLSGDLDD
ncbi:MAG: hypothetical protein JW880_05195 [Candidatus Thermoplasmatota archaeon]|nr:hypothetical protein [Candidatus Thermoplasmatota archaeon]